MAKKPIRIADVLGFGAAPRRDLTQGLRREVAKIKRGEKLQGSISRAKPTAAQELAQLLTPNTRLGNELAAKIAPVVEMSPLGLLTGLVDARRAYNAGNAGSAASAGLLAALGAVPGGRGAKVAKEAAEEAAGRGIIAYHASPHSFDKFDFSKIGSGEGAQAFGHGLYAAEEEAVAKEYHKKFAESMKSRVADRLLDEHGSFDKAIEAAKNEIDRLNSLSMGMEGNPRIEGLIDLQKKAIDELSTLRAGKQLPKPSMYQVKINASPDEMVDWDVPFSQQPANIQEAIKYAFGPQPDDAKFGTATMDIPREIHTRLLRDKGVKGIKYLDQGSRDAGAGSRNFVIFDDSLIDILKKYGIAIPAIAGGGLLAIQPQQDGGL